MPEPSVDDKLLIDPLRPIERAFNEQCSQAGLEPLVVAGAPPIGLQRSIFAIAWKSAVANYGGGHGGEFPIRIGLERGEEDKMVVTWIGISYRRLQGDVYTYRVLAKRRSIPTIVESEGTKMRIMLDGVSSEENYHVQEVPLEEGLKRMGGRAARYQLGEVSDRTKPETVAEALKRVRTFTVTVFREDREKLHKVFKRSETEVIEGVVRTLLEMRTKNMLEEPMDCPGVYPEGYTGGSREDAVKRALQELNG